MTQAPGAVICAGFGGTGIASTVQDNNQYNNRSTKNIVSWFKANGYRGISIDIQGNGMSSIDE